MEDDRPPGEEAGSTVPRYRILGLVAVGGMGVVYRAQDTRLGRIVALKFLPPSLVPNPRAKQRFLDEARAASALDHPNICTIHEIGETAEGQLFLAMPCYDGESLKQRLERGPLAVPEAVRIAVRVARGLAKAHRHGIVHRDVKPANLMITTEGIVKILDFGIAKLPEQPAARSALGSPGYMAPEQERAREVDARADVWSLGVVLYEMLAGRRPPCNEEDEDRPPAAPVPLSRPRPDSPPELDAVLRRMLARDPADRYPDAAAVLADLAAVERAAAVRTPPTAAGRAVLLPALGVSLVAMLVVAGWLLRPAGRDGAASPVLLPATLARLTDLPGREWFPSLSPDGNFFIYARKTGNRNLLLLQRVGGGMPLGVPADSPRDDTQPAFSPDGQLIAFRSERDGGGIFVMGATGEALRRVTDFGFNPAWSPDGKEILCATAGIVNPRIRKQRSQVFRVSLASGERRLVYAGDGVSRAGRPMGCASRSGGSANPASVSSGPLPPTAASRSGSPMDAASTGIRSGLPTAAIFTSRVIGMA